VVELIPALPMEQCTVCICIDNCSPSNKESAIACNDPNPIRASRGLSCRSKTHGIQSWLCWPLIICWWGDVSENSLEWMVKIHPCLTILVQVDASHTQCVQKSPCFCTSSIDPISRCQVILSQSCLGMVLVLVPKLMRSTKIKMPFWIVSLAQIDNIPVSTTLQIIFKQKGLMQPFLSFCLCQNA